MKNMNLNNKIISIERRFLEEIFNCKFEQLEKVFNLIRAFEEEFKHDLVKNLLSMVSEHENRLSLSYEVDNYGDNLINLIIGEFLSQYFIRMGIPEESEFFQLLINDLLVPDYTYITLEMPLGVEQYLLEFGITLKKWNKFRLALDSFIKKKD